MLLQLLVLNVPFLGTIFSSWEQYGAVSAPCSPPCLFSVTSRSCVHEDSGPIYQPSRFTKLWAQGPWSEGGWWGRKTRNFAGKGSSMVLAGAALATAQDPRVGEGTERHLHLEWLQNPLGHEDAQAVAGRSLRGSPQVRGPDWGAAPRRRLAVSRTWCAAGGTPPGRCWGAWCGGPPGRRGAGAAARAPGKWGLAKPRRLGRRPSLPPRARRDPAPVSGEAGVRQMHAGRGPGERRGEREPTTKLGVAARTARLE